jgi:hypothetical protein
MNTSSFSARNTEIGGVKGNETSSSAHHNYTNTFDNGIDSGQHDLGGGMRDGSLRSSNGNITIYNGMSGGNITTSRGNLTVHGGFTGGSTTMSRGEPSQ